MFDLASVLTSQRRSIWRCFIPASPCSSGRTLHLAQLLLADVLSAQNKPDLSLAVLIDPAAARPIRGRRGCG